MAASWRPRKRGANIKPVTELRGSTRWARRIHTPPRVLEVLVEFAAVLCWLLPASAIFALAAGVGAGASPPAFAVFTTS